MAFLTVGTPRPKTRRLYIMEIELPSGMNVVKVGVASGTSSKERMLQINGSIFDKFRYTAKIGIKRDREVPEEMVFKYETMLHRFFKNYRYESKHEFDGRTECFVVDLEDVVQAYEAVLEGLEPDFEYEAPTKLVDELPF